MNNKIDQEILELAVLLLILTKDLVALQESQQRLFQKVLNILDCNEEENKIN